MKTACPNVRKCFLLFFLRVVSKSIRQHESLTESYQNNKADLFEIEPHSEQESWRFLD